MNGYDELMTSTSFQIEHLQPKRGPRPETPQGDLQHLEERPEAQAVQDVVAHVHQGGSETHEMNEVFFGIISRVQL